MAQAQSGLSGEQITELVAGATIEVDTPIGTTMPLRYTRDGKVSGEAGSLAWYMGSATNSGRWWVVADKLCHRWARWFNSEPQCFRLSRQGRTYLWRTDAGSSGTARITAPATIEASAAPLWKPGRLLRFGTPSAEMAPANAYAPAAKEPTPAEPKPQQAATEHPAPAAAPTPSPAAQAAPLPAAAPAAAPSFIVPPAAAAPAPAFPANSAWPPQQAEQQAGPQPHAKPGQPALFKVANVRRDDVLNVRSGPSADHDIVGELPPGSRGIAIVTSAARAGVPCSITRQPAG